MAIRSVNNVFAERDAHHPPPRSVRFIRDIPSCGRWNVFQRLHRVPSGARSVLRITLLGSPNRSTGTELGIPYLVAVSGLVAAALVRGR